MNRWRWVGTMDNQPSRPNGSFYRIDPNGAIHRQFADIIVSNTVAFSRAKTRRNVRDRSIFVDHTGTRDRPGGRLRRLGWLHLERDLRGWPCRASPQQEKSTA